MVYSGWAFTEDYEQKRDNNMKRYNEIQHLRKSVHLKVLVGYNTNTFSGHLTGESLELLKGDKPAFDILLLADCGNLCFGGDISLSSDGKFSGRYYTD